MVNYLRAAVSLHTCDYCSPENLPHFLIKQALAGLKKILLKQTVSASPRDLLFSYMRDGKLVPLSVSTFISWLHATLTKAGFSTGAISCHSFRHGAATFAAANNITSSP